MELGRKQGGVWRDFWRDVALTLAVFALALQVFVPSGVMVSSQNGQGVFVICTGHGELTVATDDGQAPAPSKQAPHAPCAFAGHAPPFTAPLAAPLADPAFTVPRDLGPRRLASLAPGRGLAAPPPPSRGPPGLLI